MLAKKTQIVPEHLVNVEHKGLTFKVSPKKAISVYGLQRFPVTLYKDQWLTLLNNTEALKEFINAHSDELATKDVQQEE